MSRPTILILILMLTVVVGCRTDSSPGAVTDAVKIEVREDGLYQVTARELERVGLARVDFESGLLRLTDEGQEVPFHLTDDSIVFYGLASNSRYTPVRTYILRTGEPGAQMSRVTATSPGNEKLQIVQRTAHLEKNFIYDGEARAKSGSAGPWFWQTIGFEEPEPLQFDLEHVAGGGGQIQARFYGVSYSASVDPDHHIRMTLNGNVVGGFSWDGQEVYTATIPLPDGALLNGTNQITLEGGSGDVLDISRLDWISVQYDSEPRATNDYAAFSTYPGVVTLEGFSEEPLIVDVSNAGAPTVLTGLPFENGQTILTLEQEGRYIAAAGSGFRAADRLEALRDSGWADRQQQADLVIITTAELAPAMTPLIEAREEQGLTVALVPVEDIYDEFGYGRATPDSINRFLAVAYEQWQPPAPRYLLLVGDATIDYWGNMTETEAQPVNRPSNIVPPYLVSVSFGGETVSDARLADVDGDLKPEMAVGRWPADSVSQVQDLVRRTLAYEQSAASQRTIFVADDSGMEFEYLADTLLEDGGISQVNNTTLVGPGSDAFTDTWREGAWLVAYVGHGSLQLWGKNAIISADAVDLLRGSGPAPIVLQLTCLTALFAHPEITSLSETMLMHPDGPPLIIGATSLTLSVHQEPFAIALLQNLRNPDMERIGDIVHNARNSLDLESTGLREINDTFVLLGDPSARVVRP